MTLYNLYKLAVLLNCVLLLARIVLLLVRGFCVRRKLLTGGFNVQYSIVILQCHSFLSVDIVPGYSCSMRL